jgi:transposase, IS30 family
MKHLTRSKRDQLEALRKSGHRHTQQEMAEILGCAQSTISRELRRARTPSQRAWYTATTAQQRGEERRQCSYASRPHWYDDPTVLRFVIEQLRSGKSPDAIAGRMKRASPWHRAHAVSHESIYRYIWRIQEEGGCLHLHLPRKGKRPKFYGLQSSSSSRIPNRNDISERPKIVDKKKRCGDWESDLILSGRSGHGAIATFVETYSKYLRAILLPDQTADAFTMAAREVFQELPAQRRRTLTHDNGSEICKHEEITKCLGITVYCATPYSAWQRGLNEHSNGLLRRSFPKGTDLSSITQEELAEAVEKINNCPRRSLHYLTPKEVFLSGIKDYAFQS